MKTNRILPLAAMLQILWIFAGCCADEQSIYYTWTGMNTVHLDNSGQGTTENPSGPIPAAAYGMRIALDMDESTAMRFSPIPAAYATSCPEIYKYFNRDTVRAIRIHAVSDGTARDVTDDFVVLNPTFAREDRFIAIPEMIRRMNEGSQVWLRRIDLLRTTNPERSNDISFIITIDLSSGKSIADTTRSISLI